IASNALVAAETSMEIFKGISEETFEEIQEQEESTPEIVSVLKKSKGYPSRRKK
ncbi:10945_t:CDS:1, partial [Funneliformis geosporum]